MTDPENSPAYAAVDGRLAYLRAARSLRAEDLAVRMNEIERLDIPTTEYVGHRRCVSAHSVPRSAYGRNAESALRER